MYEYKCKVKRVVDGDTMDVILDLGFDIHHSVRVRMAGHEQCSWNLVHEHCSGSPKIQRGQGLLAVMIPGVPWAPIWALRYLVPIWSIWAQTPLSYHSWGVGCR